MIQFILNSRRKIKIHENISKCNKCTIQALCWAVSDIYSWWLQQYRRPGGSVIGTSTDIFGPERFDILGVPEFPGPETFFKVRNSLKDLPILISGTGIVHQRII